MRITKNLYFCFILLLAFINISTIYSQDKPKENKAEKDKKNAPSNFVFGGNIGLQFQTGVLYIEISPNMGYYITPRLMTALGLTYQYYSETYYNSTINSHIFGGRLYSEYTIFENLGKNSRIKSNLSVIGHVEYEALNLDRNFSNPSSSAKVNRFWLQGFLIGGGIKQPLGKRGSVNIIILFNINHDNRFPYTNPVLRLGFYL